MPIWWVLYTQSIYRGRTEGKQLKTIFANEKIKNEKKKIQKIQFNQLTPILVISDFCYYKISHVKKKTFIVNNLVVQFDCPCGLILPSLECEYQTETHFSN